MKSLYLLAGACVVLLLLDAGCASQPTRPSANANRSPTASTHEAELLKRGQSRMAVGDYDAAIAFFDESIAANPAQQTGYACRGQARQAKGDLDGALSDYTHLPDRDARFLFVYISRGSAKMKKGDRVGANADYARAVALAPDNPRVFAALANARFGQGDWAGAIGLADQAIALDPRCDSAWMCRGLARHHTGDNAGALADLDQLIALIPAHSAGLYNRGMIRMDMGDADGALADYALAIAAYPTNSFAYNGIAHIRELRGDFAGAQEAYQGSISAEPWRATYNRFALMLILRRRHLDESPAGLAHAVDGWQEGWTKTVGRFLLGRVAEAEFFAQAASGPAKEAREHLCEACYYAGMIHLLDNDPATARELFEKCRETGVTSFYEFKRAGDELKRLSAPTPPA